MPSCLTNSLKFIFRTLVLKNTSLDDTHGEVHGDHPSQSCLEKETEAKKKKYLLKGTCSRQRLLSCPDPILQGAKPSSPTALAWVTLTLSCPSFRENWLEDGYLLTNQLPPSPCCFLSAPAYFFSPEWHCQGLQRHPLSELEEALAILQANPLVLQVRKHVT